MKWMPAVRSALIAALVALPMAGSADAAVVLAESDNILGSGTGAKVYNFSIASPGEYNASLIDLAFPVTFDFLGMVISHTGGGKIGDAAIPPSSSPASFLFDATPGSYTAQVFAVPGSPLAVGAFSINVASVVAPVATVGAAVPEPTTWLMLIAGIGVLGALRSRRQRG